MTRGTLQVQSSPRQLRHGNISLRTEAEITAIARAGRVVASALRAAEQAATVGASTASIDSAVARIISAAGARAAFLGHPSPMGGRPYPASCCTSVNDEVVHGIPGARVLQAGDAISVDVGVELDGWYADACTTVVVGGALCDSAAACDRRALVTAAWGVLHEAIGMMEPGRRWSDIAQCMQEHAVGAGFGMVDGWMGHGIGRLLHEAPQVPCMVSAGLRERRDFTLQAGMVLAVEPIVVDDRGTIDADGCCISTPVSIAADGWTVTTERCQVAAHVEHTVAVTATGARILTTECGWSCACAATASPQPQHGGGSR